jgi:hypothetical protein
VFVTGETSLKKLPRDEHWLILPRDSDEEKSLKTLAPCVHAINQIIHHKCWGKISWSACICCSKPEKLAGDKRSSLFYQETVTRKRLKTLASCVYAIKQIIHHKLLGKVSWSVCIWRD